MEEYKKDDRGRSKAKRLTGGDPHEKVDSSSWTPSAPENAGVKTGARPLTKRLYKKGGKVVGKCEGGEAMKRADRKPRKAGGRTNHLTPDSLINRDVRTANEVREGVKHDGAFKKGGKIHKEGGGSTDKHPYFGDVSQYKNKKWDESKEKWVNKKPRPPVKSEDEVGPKSIGHDHLNEFRPGEYKKGGRAHKFTGGVGQNPVSDQDMMMGKAAGMRKSGGRAHRQVGGSNDPVGDLIRQYPAPTKTNPPKAPAKPVRPPMTLDEERAANAAAFDKEQQEYQRSLPQNQKKGGRVHKHDDVAADKALIKKMVKAEARTGRKHGGNVFSGNSKNKVPGVTGGRKAHAGGGRTQADIDFDRAMLDPNTKVLYGDEAARAIDMEQGNVPLPPRRAAPMARPAPVVQSGPSTRGRGPALAPRVVESAPASGSDNSYNYGSNRPMAAKDSESYTPEWTTPSQRALGRAIEGVGSFYGNTDPNMIYAKGGRAEHAKGGRTKGKTQVNIIIGAGGHQPQQQSMPNAPVPAPQMHMPSTPQGGPPMPPQGMPPQGMPPQGMPMPRKSGGRTSYPIETGSGGGEARLDKIKAYGLTPPKRK